MTDPRDAFVQLALARARAHEDIELALPHPGDLAIDVVPTDGATFCLTLHTLFVQTRDASPTARADALDRRLHAALAPATAPDAWSDAAPRLRTVLRAASSLGPDLRDFAARPALPGLVEAAVIDNEFALLYARAEHADGWGQDADGVVTRGRAQLHDVLFEPWDEAAGLWCAEHEYGSAQLLRGGALARLSARLGGPLVAAVPHAQLVLVGPTDPSTVARLARTADAEYGAGGRPVSPCLYAIEPAVELRVAADHPAFEALERARARLWCDEVSAAAHALGLDVQPAAIRGQDGRLHTAVRHTPAAILPEAEVTLHGPAPRGERVPGMWPPWRVS